MGEYAKYNGRSVKMGTCEDMLYLRYDQRHLVKPEEGSLDPTDAEVLKVIRFRFPWPDEDDRIPGNYDDPERSIPVCGLKVPAEVDHHNVQFSAQCGYLMSIPCPEGPGPHGPATIHKNGWRGDVLLIRQAIRAGKLVSVFLCGGCGALFRIENPEELKDVLGNLRAQSKQGTNTFYAKVADRIEAGYSQLVY